MKEMVNTEKSSNIMIGVGVLGLLAYGYMLIFSDISAENIRYSVLACAFAAFLPSAVTIRKITVDVSSGTFWSIVVGVAALFFLIAYSMVKATDDGIIFDLFAVVSSESFRWLYLVLIVVATICPFIWEKGAPWILAIALGVLVLVVLYTILIMLAVLIGCYILSLFGKSKGSTSSGFGSWLSDLSSDNKQAVNKPGQQKHIESDSRRYGRLRIEYVRESDYDSYVNSKNKACYKAIETLPLDFSHNQISKYLIKKYGLGYTPVIVNTIIDGYTGRDSVDRIAWEISN